MVYGFWISLFCIFYAYIGYVLLLWILSIGKKLNTQNTINQSYKYKPYVSLLISAYNEEKIIEKKILNSLKLDYPEDLLEIIIVSDDSNDETNNIVEKYKDSGVTLKNYNGRIGKTACLNKTVPLSKGEIIVFSDANSLYDKDAINHLTKRFVDTRIGFVTGFTKYSMGSESDTLKSIGLYSKLERVTKKLESKIGSCVGADGAIFAIRKKLYDNLNDYDINDFVIPLNIVKKDYRGVMEENAFCAEGTAKDNKGEFNRQARITNRTIRAIFNNSPMLNPFKYGIFSFQLISHKLFKYLGPLFLIILFVTNVLLLNSGSIYIVFMCGQIIFYSFYYWNFKGNNYRALKRLNEVIKSFITVNAAMLYGWIQYFSGKTYTKWNTFR